MNTIKPAIKYPDHRITASEDLRLALQALGFRYVLPTISRGCHWGDVYFFHDNLKLAYSLIEGQVDKYVRIETATHYFHLHPYNGIAANTEEYEPHWQFSVGLVHK